MKVKLFFSFLFIFLIILVSGCISDKPNEVGEYDEFAQCLTDKGVKMYGTEWCSHCKNQKELFGNSFQNIDYIDCDWNKDECQEAGVNGYPTWVIDGKNYPGEQTFDKLSSLTGCELLEGT
jgi:glutaredoxin